MQRQIALVTGANRGIGFEVARQLAQQGMTVLLGARGEKKASEAAQRLAAGGLDVRGISLDVADPDSVVQAGKQVASDFGRLDVLVNNAAAYAEWSETVSNANLKAVEELMATNLYGPWRTIQAFLPLIRQSKHGRIVNVSSGAGSHGDLQSGLTTRQGAVASYGISKAAINALTAKLAAELQETGILVNAVCPGFTATAPGMEAMGARPVEDGAASVVWAVLLPDGGPTGGFYRDGKPLPW
jgi:NAD(P)-dependent dehydrogenase (short-subunit alcohol dehydrogenase family)